MLLQTKVRKSELGFVWTTRVVFPIESFGASSDSSESSMKKCMDVFCTTILATDKEGKLGGWIKNFGGNLEMDSSGKRVAIFENDDHNFEIDLLLEAWSGNN